MHVNELLAEVNKISMTKGRKIWDVFDCETNKWLGAVGATDNQQRTAEKYAQSKYGKVFLLYRCWKEGDPTKCGKD